MLDALAISIENYLGTMKKAMQDPENRKKFEVEDFEAKARASASDPPEVAKDIGEVKKIYIAFLKGKA